MKFLLLATLISSPLLANPIAGTDSDLKADSNAVFGSMDNGFNYILYPNSEPPGKFSVRLHISAGSLMEEEDQRGVAHFLAHGFQRLAELHPRRAHPENAAPRHPIRSTRQCLHLI